MCSSLIAIMLHDIQRKAGSLNRDSLPLGFLLALIGSEKESNDLCAGAAIVRPEQAITNAVGDAVLHGPGHRVRIVAIGEHIAELGLIIPCIHGMRDAPLIISFSLHTNS